MKKRTIVVVSAITVVIVGIGAVFALSTWRTVNRVSIERPAPASPGPVAQEEGETPGEEPGGEESDFGGDEVEVFLLVGSDSRDDLEDLQGFGAFDGNRADVVMILFRTGGGAGVLSLPRDLWVESACGGEDRINALLEGCAGVMNGPTLLTLSVETLIDLPIDNFAMVDLAGFQETVDAIGGYEICVDRAVRDERSGLELPAGCTQADGDQTLAWLRSRHTEELTSSGWRIVPGVNDLVRNERQRQFLIDMMGRLADFTSPQDLASAAMAIAPFITVDDELGLLDAVNIAWTMRGLGQGDVTELSVPVIDYVTDAGASVLVAETSIAEVVSDFLAKEASRLEILGLSG